MNGPIEVPLTEELGLTAPNLEEIFLLSPEESDLPSGARERMKLALDKLSADQRDIIIRRFGLSNVPAMTDGEIAEIFNKDVAWVKQTLDEALAIIKASQFPVEGIT